MKQLASYILSAQALISSSATFGETAESTGALAAAPDTPTCYASSGEDTCPGISLVMAKQCKDATGSFMIIACQSQKGQLGDPDFKAELVVKKITGKGKRHRIAWSIYDASPDPLTSINFVERSFEAIDVNGDGRLETSFFYELIPDGLEPYTVKMMSHYKDTKYPIRGIIPKIDPYMGDYQKNLGVEFENAPSSLTRYASERWDTFVSDTYGIDSN